MFNRIENVSCTECGHAHEDKGCWKFHPHQTHLCEHCGAEFEGTRKAASYPLGLWVHVVLETAWILITNIDVVIALAVVAVMAAVYDED